MELVMKLTGSCSWEPGKGWAGSPRSRGAKNSHGEWPQTWAYSGLQTWDWVMGKGRAKGSASHVSVLIHSFIWQEARAGRSGHAEGATLPRQGWLPSDKLGRWELGPAALPLTGRLTGRLGEQTFQGFLAQMACAGKLQTQGQAAGPRRGGWPGTGHMAISRLTCVAMHLGPRSNCLPRSVTVLVALQEGPGSSKWIPQSQQARRKDRAQAQLPVPRPAILRMGRAWDQPGAWRRTDTWLAPPLSPPPPMGGWARSRGWEAGHLGAGLGLEAQGTGRSDLLVGGAPNWGAVEAALPPPLGSTLSLWGCQQRPLPGTSPNSWTLLRVALDPSPGVSGRVGGARLSSGSSPTAAG